ncbi:hypothetical protein MuYL_3586 [Mucilaginibacter xinganensis]|uniref:Uncharacterized protein n=1 Tax=Mucilaginibacter xinganensis TaxID=1234841 RepID=A0A223P0V3_9SPHI|nr:hypothetical protein MuYL_3586 [Mucilaginibacter xinganensis]
MFHFVPGVPCLKVERSTAIFCCLSHFAYKNPRLGYVRPLSVAHLCGVNNF